MASPYFFVESISAAGAVQVLPEDTSKHVIQVLRMKEGDTFHLTDGHGQVADVVIADAHKKKCTVTISGTSQASRAETRHAIAISLLKNNTRFEWFLEKATELGIATIVPLICARTEKQHFRLERMRSILISAMLQSQQSWLPELCEPVSLNKFLEESDDRRQPSNGNSWSKSSRIIAHCEPGLKKSLLDPELRGVPRKIVLIGPEGDFTPEEIASASGYGYVPITLGNTRLRTETAGVIAASLLQLS
jgi:16S rRNA (uracil1498-N3)-methyltransferase